MDEIGRMGLAVTKSKRQEKARTVEELVELFKRYKVVGVFRLVGTRSNVIQALKRNLRGKALFKVAKKNLIMIAAERVGRTNIKEYLDSVKEPIGLVFSDVDAFKLKIELDKGKVLTHAKAGEKADVDVVIPVMNTGLQPGPILSEFGKLKIPTKIEGGQIWIARETVVARKGDVISPVLASLLSKLDVPAVVKGVELLVAFDGPLLIPRDLLELNIDAVLKEVSDAHSRALSLSLSIGYPTSENIALMVMRAHREAVVLGTSAGIYEQELMPIILATAESHARILSSLSKS